MTRPLKHLLQPSKLPLKPPFEALLQAPLEAPLQAPLEAPLQAPLQAPLEAFDPSDPPPPPRSPRFSLPFKPPFKGPTLQAPFKGGLKPPFKPPFFEGGWAQPLQIGQTWSDALRGACRSQFSSPGWSVLRLTFHLSRSFRSDRTRNRRARRLSFSGNELVCVGSFLQRRIAANSSCSA